MTIVHITFQCSRAFLAFFDSLEGKTLLIIKLLFSTFESFKNRVWNDLINFVIHTFGSTLICVQIESKML